MHLNGQYRRNGNLDMEMLFNKVDLTDEIKPLLPEIMPKAEAMFEVLRKRKPPQVDLVNDCGQIGGCDLSGHCWAFLPDNHVGDLILRRETENGSARKRDQENY